MRRHLFLILLGAGFAASLLPLRAVPPRPVAGPPTPEELTNGQALAAIKNAIARLNTTLTNSLSDDGKTPLTQAQIVAGANGKLDTLPQFIAALKAAVNIAAPGTYPS